MWLRLLLAIAVAKSISSITKRFHLGGGSAAPGYYALKIYPNLISQLSKRLPKTVIITGTNGKTTTTKILSHMAQTQNLKVLRNPTGSNLERGIISAVFESYSIKDLLTKNLSTKYDLAIWELDEAAFARFGYKLAPEIVVFLNIFRDQLDRYGEVNLIVKRWTETIEKLDKDTLIILNNDDHSLEPLVSNKYRKNHTFGLSSHRISGEKISQSKKHPDFEAIGIKESGLEEISFEVTFLSQKYPVSLPIPGIYHIYDFLAAFACAYYLGFSLYSSINSLKSFLPAFGRVEKLQFGPPEDPKFGYIFLIKNPTGTSEVLKTISPHIQKEDRLLLALNDNLADGTDVSWVWDSQFEILRKSHCQKVIVSGSRSYDLALRLKYAGINVKDMQIEPNLSSALNKGRDKLKGKLFIMPTYTAMLEIQKLLTKQGFKQDYWKQTI